MIYICKLKNNKLVFNYLFFVSPISFNLLPYFRFGLDKKFLAVTRRETFGGDDRTRTCDPLHVKQVL